MGSKPIVVGQTISGLATISSISANNSLTINFGRESYRDYVVLKWRNGGAGTAGMSLRDILSGAAYCNFPMAAGTSGMTSFVRGDGQVQANISNVSGNVLIDAWIDGVD